MAQSQNGETYVTWKAFLSTSLVVAGLIIAVAGAMVSYVSGKADAAYAKAHDAAQCASVADERSQNNRVSLADLRRGQEQIMAELLSISKKIDKMD